MSNTLCIFRISLCIFKSKNGHSRDALTVKILIFFDSAAKNYPGSMRDQNKYDTFDFCLTLSRHHHKNQQNPRKQAGAKMRMSRPKYSLTGPSAQEALC